MPIEITTEYLSSQGLSANTPERFWSKVSKTDTCWPWVGGTSTYGYGRMSCYGTPESLRMSAHRISYLLHYGPIPEGMTVIRACDEILCVRPDHLLLKPKILLPHPNPELARLGFNYGFERNFWFWVKQSGFCLLWTGTKNACGYGSFNIGTKSMLAHRVAWILKHGEIPDGLEICHDCPGGDNRACVNVEHLHAWPHIKNIEDAVNKGAYKRGESGGAAKLTEETVLAIRADFSNGMTRAAIAEKHKTSMTNAFAIIHRQSWKHI